MENMSPNKPSCEDMTMCGCVGYGYVPVQMLEGTYSVSKAVIQGTLFPGLDLNIDEYGKVCKQGGSL